MVHDLQLPFIVCKLLGYPIRHIAHALVLEYVGQFFREARSILLVPFNVEGLKVVDMLAELLNSQLFTVSKQMTVSVENRKYSPTIGYDACKHFTLPLLRSAALRISSGFYVGPVLLEDCEILSEERLYDLAGGGAFVEPHSTKQALKLMRVLTLPSEHHHVWEGIRRLVNHSVAVCAEND
ncbi:hypothetical protein DIE08_30025 [Burkholderia sp. Bp9004]|nr:hypothetical protein DIE08_30025 [Burkholderia sp. Bp9004]